MSDTDSFLNPNVFLDASYSYASRLQVRISAAREGAGVHGGGGHCAGARDRREYRHLQSHEHAALPPPHYANANEVVQVFSQDKKNPKTFRGFSYPTYLDIREQNTVFSGVMAHNLAMVGLGDKGNTRRAFTAVTSANYFSVMGVMPSQGRTFRAEEETPGRNAQVAIVSYNYWKREGLNSAMLGSTITIDSRPFTVIGIMPEGFTGTAQIFAPELWLPLGVYDQVANDFETGNKGRLDDRNGRKLMLVGRLKPGMTAAAATPALKALAANLEQAYPVEQKDQTFMVDALSRFSLSTSPSSGNKIKRLAPLLFGMSGIVLLVACLNLANMLLARGSARRKEIAIRLALGGSRWRIVRQLLIEGFVLALAGGICRIAPRSLVVRSARRLVRQNVADRYRVAGRPEHARARGDLRLLFARDVCLRARAGAEVVEVRRHRRFEGTRR